MKKSEFNKLCHTLTTYATKHGLYSSPSMNGKDYLSVHFAPGLDSDLDSSLSLHISNTDIILDHPLRYTRNDGPSEIYTSTEELINILKGFCYEK